MLKSIIIFKTLLAIQVLEYAESQLVFDSIEYILSIILVGLAAIVMMLIPMVLCYCMIVNFFHIKTYKTKDTDNWNCGNTFGSRCVKVYSSFFKYFLALVAWNVFSLLFIVFGFKSFSVGLKEYFYFPFYIIDSILKNDLFNTVYLYRLNCVYMIVIIMLTFTFYLIGKYVGRLFAENKTKKEEFSFR